MKYSQTSTADLDVNTQKVSLSHLGQTDHLQIIYRSSTDHSDLMIYFLDISGQVDPSSSV